MRRLMPVFGLAAVVLVAACGGTDPTATPQPRATPQATAVPVATATPRPTAPPAAATATTAIAPTATLVPTPRPSPTPIPPATAAPATVVQRGGVLREAASSATASFSVQTPIRSAQLGPAHEWVARQLFHTIMWNDPYDNNTLKGMLADRWEFKAGADQVTFRVNPAAVWSDGKPILAQDLKYNIDLWVKPPDGFTVASPAQNIGRVVKSVSVLDDRNLVINLNRPSVSIVNAFATDVALIIPSHRTLAENAKNPVGSTAFNLANITTDVKFTLVKNPRYWIKSAKGEQLPYLDGIESILFVDGARVYAALVTGQLDLAHVQWGQVVRGKLDDAKRSMPDAVLEKRFASAHGWGFKNKPPYNDPKVLRAFHIATDRLAGIELNGGGEGVLDSIGVLSASAGSSWAIPMAEVLRAPGFRYLDRKTGQLATDVWQLVEGLSAKYQRDPNDIKLAKQLLAEAGYADPSKFPTIKLTGDNTFVEQAATVNAQTLQDQLGVKVQLDIRDLAAVTEDRTNGRFEAVQTFVHGVAFDPSLSLRAYTTTGSVLGNHGFVVPELDDLYERQDREVDPAKRKDLVFAMQRKILDGVHIIPIYGFHATSGVVRGWVRNMPLPVLSSTTVWWFDQVWIDRAASGSRA